VAGLHPARSSHRALALTPEIVAKPRQHHLRPQTDRVNNVLAAGGCELRTRGQANPLGSPRLCHDQSRAAIRPVERQALRILNVADFLSLTPAPASPAAPGQSPA
jgi:hypothetical protein